MEKLKNFLLDILFPAKCAGCRLIGFFICPACLSKITLTKTQTCPDCNRISSTGRYCTRCKPKHSIEGIFTCGTFKDQILKNILHKYKYRNVLSFTPLLSTLVTEKIKTENLKPDLIAYVPITKKRLRWRGYNQSELLAHEVGAKLGLPVFGGLLKTKDTKTQVGLRKTERRDNLHNAFCAINDPTIKNKQLLIVDDICTTGSTLNECAKTLKQAGAKSVYGVVVAKE